MQPLKILYTEAATSYGGQERYIHRLMKEMRGQGHQVEALCQPRSLLEKYLEQDGFKVHTFTMHSGGDFWRNLFPMRRFLKAHQYDVVNTHSRRDTVHVGAAARLARVPLVVRTRHLARPVGSLLSYSWIPHRVIAVSQFVKNQIVQRGMDENKVEIVYPAVDFPEPLPEPKLRQELGLSAQAMIVGSVAVLRKEKGIQELIQALAPLMREQAELHLVVIGGGELQTKLEDFSAQLDVAKQVHMLGTRDDVALLIGDFDIFALATHLEASGTVFAEAGAARLPIVGTNVGGVSEMIDVGKSGMLVPLHDIVALRKALQHLLENADLRESMAQAGYSYARLSGRFSLKTMQERTESSYRRWLEQLG